MYKEFIEKYYVLIAIVLFFMSYVMFWPYNFMITDAYSYVAQAMAFANGELGYWVTDGITGMKSNLIRSPYSLGNASYLAVFTFLLGKHGIFAGSLFSVIASVWLCAKTLRNLQLSSLAVCLVFLSPAVMFYSRSLMSCMPSMLCISLFLYVYSRPKYTHIDYLLLGFIGGLSIWFRETNIILLAPLCLYVMYKHNKAIVRMLMGGIMGVSVKLLTSYFVYGNVWFVSASAGFSIHNIVAHTPIYLLINMAIFPLGLLWLFYYQERGNRVVKIAGIMFIAVYVLYNYTAVEYSGIVKGSLLTSRFMIPLIPFMVLGLGSAIKRHAHFYSLVLRAILPLSFVLIPTSMYIFHSLYATHENAAKELSILCKNHELIYDQSGFTNTIRYVNPLTMELDKSIDLSQIDLLPDATNLQGKRAVISMSNCNAEKISRANNMKQNLAKLSTTFIEKIEIDNNNWLEVYEVL